MLYKLHTILLVLGVLTIGLMAAVVYEKAFSVITVGSVIAFITQGGLLLHFSKEEERNYSDKVLFLVVLFYSIMLGTVFIWISYYYDRDTFMFSKTDAMLYYNVSMHVAESGFKSGIKAIMDNYAFDDWGAMIFDSIIMSILPYKLFLNAVYMVLGALSSVLLFRVSQLFMPVSYAFLAALSYGTSSYLILFHCTFLKESLFIFIVICTIYYLYKFIAKQTTFSLLAAILCLILLLLFRPAVAGMIAVSAFVYYGITMKGTAISLFLYVVAIGGFLISMKMIQGMVDSYTAGGDVDSVIAYRSNSSYSGSFNYFVSFFGAFLGPFPAFFSKGDTPSRLVFYGAGLMNKLFLVIPFWAGVLYSMKKKVLEMIPLILFILLEMVSAAYICASLELRKVLLHMPFMYILAFYGLYRWFQPVRLTHFFTFFTYIVVIGITFFWNVIRA